jgi:hypothetical protein
MQHKRKYVVVRSIEEILLVKEVRGFEKQGQVAVGTTYRGGRQ